MIGSQGLSKAMGLKDAKPNRKTPNLEACQWQDRIMEGLVTLWLVFPISSTNLVNSLSSTWSHTFRWNFHLLIWHITTEFPGLDRQYFSPPHLERNHHRCSSCHTSITGMPSNWAYCIRWMNKYVPLSLSCFLCICNVSAAVLWSWQGECSLRRWSVLNRKC